ncbi:MAG: hypothetical protein L6435_06085 [Anaerolineae bacterium]|nr:hypothetical protein [Anaerolineae bacterium]
MERKTYLRRLLAGALGGAVIGVLLALAYHKWSDKLSTRRRTERISPTLRRSVNIRQAAQIGTLGFQLLREIAHLFQPKEST